jgi:hypothetical protein
MTSPITQLNDLTYDVCFWADCDIHKWLEEYGGEFSLQTEGAPPSHWILTFKNESESILFKLRWF